MTMSLPNAVVWSLRDGVYVVNKDWSLMMWEGSDRSRTRWWGVRGEVLILPLRREGNAFKLTCRFVSEDDFPEERLVALDGIFEESMARDSEECCFQKETRPWKCKERVIKAEWNRYERRWIYVPASRNTTAEEVIPKNVQKRRNFYNWF